MPVRRQEASAARWFSSRPSRLALGEGGWWGECAVQEEIAHNARMIAEAPYPPD